MRIEKIIDLIKERNIKIYEVNINKETLNKGIEIICLEDFLDFIGENNVRCVFLYEVFDDIDTDKYTYIHVCFQFHI